MSKKIKKEAKKLLLKTTKAGIGKKIEGVLADVKASLGEKEFKKRLKKATALFSEGMVVKKKKPTGKKEKKDPKKESAREQATELTA